MNKTTKPEKCAADGCYNDAIGGPADRGSSRYCRRCINQARWHPGDPSVHLGVDGGISIPESLRRP